MDIDILLNDIQRNLPDHEVNILRITIYVADYETEQQVRSKLDQLNNFQMPFEVVAQRPLGEGECTYSASAWGVKKQPNMKTCNQNSSVSLSHRGCSWAVATVNYSELNRDPQKIFSAAFNSLVSHFSTLGFEFNDVIRVWIYTGGITKDNNGIQNYEHLNRVRHNFFNGCTFSKNMRGGGYPASTGIGIDQDQVILTALACKPSNEMVIEPVENRVQTSAFHYPEKLAPAPPCFSRAVRILFDNGQLVLVSGTASIVEAETVYVGNIVEQTRQTLDNIEALLRQLQPQQDSDSPLKQLVQCIVYIKFPDHFSAVKTYCETRLSLDIPRLYTKADICRDNLLVEIEAICFLSETRKNNRNIKLPIKNYPISVVNYLERAKLYDYDVDNSKIFNSLCVPWNHEMDIKNTGGKQSIYVGYPWCESFCPFCVYSSRRSDRPEQIDPYINFLYKESKFLRIAGCKSSSIYYGGGTPTSLNCDDLNKYLSRTREFLPATDNAVVTIETNVTNATEEKLAVASNYANRLSVGVQRFNTELRRTLGRRSDFSSVYARLIEAKRYFNQINIDLIYGVPGDTEAQLLQELSFFVELGLTSLTLYKLQINNVQRSRYDKNSPGTVACARLFGTASTFLKEAGFEQHPFGWFIRSSRTADNWKTRIEDWTNYIDYYGIGPNAYSHLNHFYYQNLPGYKEYTDALKKNILPIALWRKKSGYEVSIQWIMRKFRSSGVFSKKELHIEFEKNPEIMDELYDIFTSPPYIEFFEHQDDLLILREQYQFAVHWILHDICHLIKRHLSDVFHG